jgi:hypothetical protein
MFFLVYVWIILLLYLAPSFFLEIVFCMSMTGSWSPNFTLWWSNPEQNAITWELVSLFLVCLKGDSCTLKSITTCFLLFFARMKQLLILPLSLLAIVASRIYIVFAFWGLYLSLWTLQLLNLNHVNTNLGTRETISWPSELVLWFYFIIHLSSTQVSQIHIKI